MSDIRADLIRNSSGNGPINLSWPRASDGKMVGQSAAKAYGSSDNHGTVVFGFNVDGVVDDGVGKRTFNFTSALADANYAAPSTPFAGTGMTHAISGRTTTSASTDTDTNAGVSADRGVSISIHGDLA